LEVNKEYNCLIHFAVDAKQSLSSQFLRKACLHLQIPSADSSDFTSKAAKDAVALVTHFYNDLTMPEIVRWALLLAGGVRENHRRAGQDKVLQAALDAMSSEDAEAYKAFKSYHHVIRAAALSKSEQKTAVKHDRSIQKNSTPEKYRVIVFALALSCNSGVLLCC
jgi:hypothetical protein